MPSLGKVYLRAWMIKKKVRCLQKANKIFITSCYTKFAILRLQWQKRWSMVSMWWLKANDTTLDGSKKRIKKESG